VEGPHGRGRLVELSLVGPVAAQWALTSVLGATSQVESVYPL
jgi:hypothetical protein